MNGAIQGVAACPRGPRNSHLFFANDSIIFYRATSDDCAHLEQILETYEHATGQQLNREKTSSFFSHNTPLETQEDIKNRFGAEIIRQHETYLGLPSLVGRSKRNTFRALKERLDNKLSGWKEKLPSQAGKEILIKAVAQDIPTYTMSVFKLPDTLCDEMTSMVRNFWWGQKEGRNKIAWLSWDKMCTPKKDGGGFAISRLSTRLSWQSRAGASKPIHIHYSTVFSRHVISLTMISFMLNLDKNPPMLGEV
ncbi:uncharacterized protein LOC115970113 [Quercus lobata]|uniref:uncharacterized protein LOC115970113 n=1 Tax=Quercus lobata TaxID=97700 RepID=UPI001245C151|nr:uncharacterized protein LOC115970113 [Quercus lobata]